MQRTRLYVLLYSYTYYTYYCTYKIIRTATYNLCSFAISNFKFLLNMHNKHSRFRDESTVRIRKNDRTHRLTTRWPAKGICANYLSFTEMRFNRLLWLLHGINRRCTACQADSIIRPRKHCAPVQWTFNYFTRFVIVTSMSRTHAPLRVFLR